MTTKINATKLIKILGTNSTTFHELLRTHRDKLRMLCKPRKILRKVGSKKVIVEVKPQCYNSETLHYIVFNIWGDVPEGYLWQNGTLVKEVS